MEGGRKVNDRNLVVFGIPDVPIEREISYIKDELQRRAVVADAPRPNTPAPSPTPTATPAPLILNGLLTSPQIHLQSYAFFSEGDSSSFVYDSADVLGGGAGTFWFLVQSDAGTGDTLPGGTSDYSLVSYVQSTDTTTLETPPGPRGLQPGVLRGLANNKVFYLTTGKAFVAEIQSFSNKLEIYDPSLSNYGATAINPPPTSYVPAQSATSTSIAIDYHSSMVVSGVTYIVSRQYAEVYNTATDAWVGTILGPDGVNPPTTILTKGSYMWCQWNLDLYSAPASLTPTWTLRSTDNVTLTNDLVDIMPTTGELIVAVNNSGSGVRRGIQSYDFTTGTRTDRAGIFSAAGLPSTDPQFAGTADVEPGEDNFRVIAGENFVVFVGDIRSDALGTTLYESSTNPTNKLWVRAVWVLSGASSTLATNAVRLTATDVSSWPAPSGSATTWFSHVYGTAVVSGTKVYTWLGGSIIQSDAGYNDLTAQVESWIREHTI